MTAPTDNGKVTEVLKQLAVLGLDEHPLLTLVTLFSGLSRAILQATGHQTR